MPGTLPPDPPSEPPAPAPCRRHRGKILLGIGGFLLLAVFGPMAAAPFVKAHLVEELNREIDGHLRVEEFSLNPFGRMGLEGLILVDHDGRPVLTAQRAWASTSLFRLIQGGFDGSLVVEGVTVHLRPAAGEGLRLDEVDLEAAARDVAPPDWRFHFHPLPLFRGTVEIKDSRVVLHDHAGGTHELDLKLAAVLDGLDQPALVSATLRSSDPSGSAGSVSLQGEVVLSDGHYLNPGTLTGVVTVDFDGLQLDALGAWFEDQASARGLAGRADGRVVFSKAPGEALRVEPELELAGWRSPRFRSERVRLSGVVDGLPGWQEQEESTHVLRLELDGYQTDAGLGPLLSRVHPLFASGRGGSAQLAGRMDLALDLAYRAPFEVVDGRLPREALRGVARIELAPSSLSGSPFLVQLIDATGAGQGQAGLTLAPIQLAIDGDRLRFAQPWMVRLGELETAFRGSVAGDGSLSMEWLLPVTEEVARRHSGLAGSVGETVAVPVGGTLQRPDLDWLAVAPGDSGAVPVLPAK